MATLRFSNGMLGTINSGYYLDTGYHTQVRIWGSKGWINLDSTGDTKMTWYENEGPQAKQIQAFEALEEAQSSDEDCADTPTRRQPFSNAVCEDNANCFGESKPAPHTDTVGDGAWSTEHHPDEDMPCQSVCEMQMAPTCWLYTARGRM